MNLQYGKKFQNDDKLSELLKGKAVTCDKNVAAWKTSHPFSKSEEIEAPASHQKDRFTYFKTSKSDKEHVKVTEDEKILKNKFAYRKRAQSVSNQ